MYKHLYLEKELRQIKRLTISTMVLASILIILSCMVFGRINLEATPTNQVDIPTNQVDIPTNQVDIPIVEITPTKEIPKKVETPVPTDAQLKDYIHKLSEIYSVDPYIVMGIIDKESDWNRTAKAGNCLGLMQIHTSWHCDRAIKLGVKNFYDPYDNIHLGIDYISELKSKYKDIRLVLMLYNMSHDKALEYFNKGVISKYASDVIEIAERYRNGG